MDTLSAILACCLLVTSVTVAQTERGNLTMGTINPPVSNATQTTTVSTTSTNPTANTTVTSNVYKDTTAPLSSATRGNETQVETTIHPPTSQSTTTTVTQAVTNSTTLTTSTPAASTFTELTASESQTTAGYTSTSDTTVITTANSSHTDTQTSQSEDKTTQGVRLNVSERNMTIVFSVVLGLFVLSLVILTLHKCKQKMQYVHQPLNNSEEPSAFVPDSDTLVISGGLYDDYPINDNIPTIPEDQSQLRLEFLH